MSLKRQLILIFLCLFLITPFTGPVLKDQFRSHLSSKREFEERAHDLLWRRAHNKLDPWGHPFPQTFCISYSVGPNGIDEGGHGDDITFSGPWAISWGPGVNLAESAPLHYFILILGSGLSVAVLYRQRMIYRKYERNPCWVFAAIPVTVALLWVSNDVDLAMPFEHYYRAWLFQNAPDGVVTNLASPKLISYALQFSLFCSAMTYTFLCNEILGAMTRRQLGRHLTVPAQSS